MAATWVKLAAAASRTKAAFMLKMCVMQRTSVDYDTVVTKVVERLDDV